MLARSLLEALFFITSLRASISFRIAVSFTVPLPACMDNSVIPKKFLRIGLNNIYSSIVGSPQYLRTQYEMDSNAIVKKVLELFS